MDPVLSPARSVTIAGIRIDGIRACDVEARVAKAVSSRIPCFMAVTNASKTVLAQEDAELHNILCRADLLTADGMSVVWASRVLRSPLPERVTGIDTMLTLVERASREGWSIYLLGAQPHVVEKTVQTLLGRFPGLRVAGFHDGYFDKNTADMANEIKKAAPDLLFVAMGSPAQEKWIAQNLPLMEIPFALGVGGSFDHIAGFSKRAPIAWQKAGFEWLFRLLSEPRRLWKRYLIGNLKFGMLVLLQCLKPQPERKHKSP